MNSLFPLFLCVCLCSTVCLSAGNTTDLTKTLDSIEARRSVRKYDPNRTVDDETLHTIIDCAMCSPSAMNSREWRFITVRDPTTRAMLAEALPYCKFATDPSAVVIVVAAELAAEKDPGNWPANCAAASLSMLVGATSLGVGSTWTGLYPHEDRMQKVSTILGIPDGIEPFSCVVFGYPPPDQPLEIRPSRFEPKFVHSEHW